MTTVYLVRHGQASFGAERYDRLSDTGREQARRLGKHFQQLHLRFDHVWAGTLERQRDTLDEVAGVMRDGGVHVPPPRIDPRLNEYDFEPVYKTYAALHGQEPPSVADKAAFFRWFQRALKAWIRAEVQGQAVEPFVQFRARVEAVLHDALGHAGPDGKALLVTSGGVISALLIGLYELPGERFPDFALTTNNASITRLVRIEGRLLLAGYNHLPHLEHPDARHLITFT